MARHLADVRRSAARPGRGAGAGARAARRRRCARRDPRATSEDTLTSARAARRAARRCSACWPSGRAEPARRSCSASARPADSTPAPCSQGDAADRRGSGKPLPWATLLAASERAGRALPGARPGRCPTALLGATARSARRARRARRSSRTCSTTPGRRSRHASTSAMTCVCCNYRNWSTGVRRRRFTPLHSAALADGRFAARRIDRLDLYAASIPVFAVDRRGHRADRDAPARRDGRQLGRALSCGGWR